jgi:hypothetical protein
VAFAVALLALVRALKGRTQPFGPVQRWAFRRWVARQRQASRLRRAYDALADARRYADEVGVAAQRASVMAERTSDDRVAAQRTRQAAWRAYEHAQEAVDRVRRAAVFPLEQGPPTPDELRARRRYLHRVASKAHDEGTLSAAQLADALTDRGGFDPSRHPFEQQLMLRQATRDRLLRTYQEAVEIERHTVRAADLAGASKRCLDAEAREARVRVHWAQAVVQSAAAEPFTHRLRRVMAAVPRPT